MVLWIDTKSTSNKANTLSMLTCVEKCFTKAMEEFSNIEKCLRVNSIWGVGGEWVSFVTEFQWLVAIIMLSRHQKELKDFPGGSVVKNLPANCRGHRFSPWFGKISHAVGQLNPCATTTEPVLWSLCSTTREVTAVRSPQHNYRVLPAHCN